MVQDAQILRLNQAWYGSCCLFLFFIEREPRLRGEECYGKRSLAIARLMRHTLAENLPFVIEEVRCQAIG